MSMTAVESAWLRRHLGTPGADPGPVAARVRREPKRIGTLLHGLESDTAPVRFGSSKVLRLVSETSPDLLYPSFEMFAAQLYSRNSFLAWDAARVVANLAKVDRAKKVDRLLDQYLAFIAGPQMIAAATVIQGAATIALAKPRLAERIVEAILSVQHANYDTEECRNVAIGHAIHALDRMWTVIVNRGPVLAFIGAQLENPRAPTRNKAARFLKTRRSRDALASGTAAIRSAGLRSG
jgi:hypothetical protein